MKRVFSGAPWEKEVGYCRAVRSGGRIAVSGTAPVGDDGKVAAPGDGYRQALRCLEIAERALRELGADRSHVTRTRLFVTDIGRWREFGRAHAEYFGDSPPATSMVEVKALIDPAMLVEIEVEADGVPESGGAVEWRRGEYVVSTDRGKLDFELIYGFVSNSYWARGRTREVVRRTVDHSLVFGLFDADGRQIGCTRVVTDYAVLGYLMDVFVLESHRGKGLGAWLLHCVLSHPELRTVKWMLGTTDAHGFYAKHGFRPVERAERLMEKPRAAGVTECGVFLSPPEPRPRPRS